ncbi:hypothetical protein B0H15DRAFT_577804 [Mycena belliarum]|uniref:Uncharacterized protein n=1 Tax=Mycena belliarum TaxID=1033014 RepID=A0AAD6TRB6_9AGAR|nr:hypothetical protein B0H15DRAFT_577804 [Mycena belliae]
MSWFLDCATDAARVTHSASKLLGSNATNMRIARSRDVVEDGRHSLRLPPPFLRSPGSDGIHWLLILDWFSIFLNGSRIPGRLWIYRMELLAGPHRTYEHSYMLKPNKNSLRISIDGERSPIDGLVRVGAFDLLRSPVAFGYSTALLKYGCESRSKRCHTFPRHWRMSGMAQSSVPSLDAYPDSTSSSVS